jgi:hypothetical protein
MDAGGTLSCCTSWSLVESRQLSFALGWDAHGAIEVVACVPLRVVGPVQRGRSGAFAMRVQHPVQGLGQLGQQLGRPIRLWCGTTFDNLALHPVDTGTEDLICLRLAVGPAQERSSPSCRRRRTPLRTSTCSGDWLSRIGIALAPVPHRAGRLSRIGRELGVRSLKAPGRNIFLCKCPQ